MQPQNELKWSAAKRFRVKLVVKTCVCLPFIRVHLNFFIPKKLILLRRSANFMFPLTPIRCYSKLCESALIRHIRKTCLQLFVGIKAVGLFFFDILLSSFRYGCSFITSASLLFISMLLIRKQTSSSSGKFSLYPASLSLQLPPPPLHFCSGTKTLCINFQITCPYWEDAIGPTEILEGPSDQTTNNMQLSKSSTRATVSLNRRVNTES